MRNSPHTGAGVPKEPVFSKESLLVPVLARQSCLAGREERSCNNGTGSDEGIAS